MRAREGKAPETVALELLGIKPETQAYLSVLAIPLLEKMQECFMRPLLEFERSSHGVDPNKKVSIKLKNTDLVPDQCHALVGPQKKNQH